MNRDEDPSSPKEDRQQQVSRLFIEHYSYVRYIAMMTAPARDLVDDIVNEAFVDFSRSAEKWDLDRDVKPLLRQITINAARVCWRKQVRQLPETLAQIAEVVRTNIVSNDFDAENGNFNRETEALRACMEKLSPECRELIKKYYFEKKTVKEITEEGKWNHWALYKSLTRIRLVLKTCIEKVLAGVGYE